jgi:hypothetical protein
MIMANVNANLTRNYKMRSPSKGYAFFIENLIILKPILLMESE